MKIEIELLNIVSKPSAYLDPGSGSIILQLILAGIFGVGLMIKLFWKKIIGLFRHDRKNENETADPTEINAEDKRN